MTKKEYHAYQERKKRNQELDQEKREAYKASLRLKKDGELFNNSINKIKLS